MNNGCRLSRNGEGRYGRYDCDEVQCKKDKMLKGFLKQCTEKGSVEGKFHKRRRLVEIGACGLVSRCRKK